MASFECDQAEGLRRMLAGPKPRIFTFLSAASATDKSAMLVNLSASLALSGSDVVLLDACSSNDGISHRMGAELQATLLDVARQERALNQVVHAMPQGFGLASLTRGSLRAANGSDQHQQRRLSNAFGVLAAQSDVLMVDAELDMNDNFAIPAMGNGEIIVQVTPGAASIKKAYALIKRLNAQLGRRPFGILVTGADAQEAAVVYQNMAQAASRYLALQLHSVGFVPQDDHMTRAARLGRAVIDAFPLAGASVAFRGLAERFTLSAHSAKFGA
ncbi:MinD/ParA family ATP-binding protein [Herminiimonas contaminans]|uniref:Antiactivator of flagellar biosynthesis FleN protein n=1 Tax=Herminiimonas contaminans TaxID=1111140 RepID=A0ABS0ETM7_9BURK|nr:antiactivator of flagellar biosynthesis FleN protein [Herminiimonas contaminans]MBF8176533.1 antiactivator of flagellar biosynthesis FleN protein [Herminiimonas contaminans]